MGNIAGAGTGIRRILTIISVRCRDAACRVSPPHIASAPAGDGASPVSTDEDCLLTGNFARPLKNRQKHCFSQLARLRILVRRMVRSQKDASIGERVLRAVAKLVAAFA